jgi:hypothetical protein
MSKESFDDAVRLKLNFSKEEMLDLDRRLAHGLDNYPTGVGLAIKYASTAAHLYHTIKMSIVGGDIFERPGEDLSVFTCPLEELPLKINDDCWETIYIAKWRLELSK